MHKKSRKEEPVNSGKALERPVQQANHADSPGIPEEATLIITGADLTGELLQAQQVDSAMWAQGHLGNAATKDLSEGVKPHIPPPLKDLKRSLTENGGAPLGDQLKLEMESSFNQDFRSVRIHSDEPADKATERLHARAFTIGHDIYFSRGEYNASTSQGKELIGHELAHVAQQGEVTGTNPVAITQPDSAAEIEAMQASKSIAAGKDAQVMPHPELAGTVARGIDPWSSPGAERCRREATDARLRERSQLYSEFSRLVLHRIRISQEFLRLETPDYRMASDHMQEVYNYCLDALRRHEESGGEPREECGTEPESGFFQPEQTFEAVMAQLPQWPDSLIEGLQNLTDLIDGFSTTLNVLIDDPRSRTEEANSRASLELAEIYRQARDLWLRIQTQP